MEPHETQGPDPARHIEQFERNRLAPVVFLVLFAASIVALVYTVHDFLLDLLFGLILVGLFARVQQRAERLCGGRRWLASALVTVLVATSVLAPVVALGVMLVSEAASAYEVANATLHGSPGGLLASFAKTAHGLLQQVGIQQTELEIHEQLVQFVASARSWVFQHAGSVVNNLAEVVMHFGVVLLVVFYLLVEGDQLKRYVFRLSPLPDDEEELLLRTFRQVARGTLYSNGVASVGQGVLCGLAMALAGFNSPVLWGCVMAVFAFLPLVGVSTVVIPAAIYLYLAGEHTTALLFIGFCTVVALVMENVVKTKMLGAGAAMHDLLVFLAVVGGIAVFGLFGLILGPLIAASFMTLAELYLHSYRTRLASRYQGQQP